MGVGVGGGRVGGWLRGVGGVRLGVRERLVVAGCVFRALEVAGI